jgi:hypothetical protein
MDPDDILSNLSENPEEQKREHQLIEDLNVLRDRLLRDRPNVGGVRPEYGLLRDD